MLIRAAGGAHGARPSGPCRANRESPQARGLIDWVPGEYSRASALLKTPITWGGSFDSFGRTFPMPIHGIFPSADQSGGAGGNATMAPGGSLYLANTDPITISVWCFLNQSSASFANRGIWEFGIDAGWSCSLYFNEQNGYSSLKASVVTTSAGAAQFDATVGSLVSPLVWHLFTYVFTQGGGLFLYVDGVQAATNGTATTTLRDTSQFTLYQTNAHAGTNVFPGTIVDARIYKRALTPGEVWALYDPATRWDLYLVRTKTIFAFAGGSAFTQSLAGAVIPAGALVKAAQKTPTGLWTPSGAFIKFPSSRPAGSLSSAGSVGKTAQTRPAGNLTPSGAVARAVQKAVGGTISTASAIVAAVARVCAGALSTAGALVKVPQLAKSGSLTPVGAVSKQAQQQRAGVLAPTGSASKIASLSAAGSMGTSGALGSVRAALQSLTGEMSMSGALTKLAQKLTTGAVSPSGATQKAVQTHPSGGLTPTGTLTSLRAVIQTLAGAVTFAGALQSQPAKAVSGTLATAGSVTRASSKWLRGILTWIGHLVTSGGTISTQPAWTTTEIIVPAVSREIGVEAVDREVMVPPRRGV